MESIGDAYMVIAGTGENGDHHAERVANTALGMMIAVRDVPSPIDQTPINVSDVILGYVILIQ